MTPLQLALAGVGAIAASGGLALLLGRTPRAASSIAALGAVAGGACGAWAALAALAGGWKGELSASWTIPGGAFVVGIDPLSAFFLAPVFALGAACAVYGRSYLGPRPVPAASLNLLVAAMALVLLARHALVFLVAWEAMTLLAYLLVTADHGDAEVRRAGWVYLIASHVAVIALVALFLALGDRAGGALEFSAFARAPRASPAHAALLLALALLGFGIKAGVVGLHVWLPEAHAAAPSHVSALMSGALIKLGLYGILRAASMAAPGAWFGVTLMALGIAGALLGIGLALYQRDLKRVLAYSSVENVGIVLVGLGLGFWARAHGDAALAAIAFAGGLLHVWNHAAMKGLMFLGAGSVLHGAGTKDVEQLGGLLRRMPWTGWLTIAGAVAIASLPPLNGFASEWLLYRGLARVGVAGASPSSLAAIAGAAAVALAGGLAALCFVRWIGVVLLGAPRSERAARAHESPAAMTLPMAVLAAACAAGALAAPRLVSLQGPLLAELAGGDLTDVAAAARLLDPIALGSLALLAAIATATALLLWRVRRAAAIATWGCGYAAPTPRMQYTGRAFAELASARVLPRWLQPRLREQRPSGVFPTAARFASDATDPLTRGAYEPFLARWGDRFARLRFVQQGNVHVYILYILAAAVAGLVWTAVRERWAP
jgi:formate hydrogenlyase subunit 3/multisubunit Na+/H+ antiporter MnhD subunit